MDTKKYIIEIPDNTAWLQWVKVSDKDGHVYFDFKDPEDLATYTEPDFEAIRNEAYEKGVQDTKQHWVDAPRSFAYKLGYENGLNAAWDVARKIGSNSMCSLEEMGFDFGQCVVNDYNPSWFVVKNYSASECIEKIRQYELEKEDFKVGDEVISDEDVKGVTVDMDDYLLHVLDENGVVQAWLREDVVKTDRYFPEIAEVIKKMQEKKIMSRLDDVIADVAYILDILMVYRNIVETGNCNICKNKDCQWKPKLGQLVRYNCPHYKAEENDG